MNAPVVAETRARESSIVKCSVTYTIVPGTYQVSGSYEYDNTNRGSLLSQTGRETYQILDSMMKATYGYNHHHQTQNYCCVNE